MTAEQVKQIDEAMTMAGGDRVKACVLLGFSRDVLYQKLRQSPELKAKWVHIGNTLKQQTIAPIAVEALVDRESPARLERPPPVNDKEMALIINLTNEDNKFRASMEGLRLTKEEMDMASSLQRFQGKHFAKTVDLITGGMSVTSLRLMTIIERLVDRLNRQFTDVTNGEITVEALDQERMLWAAFHKCCANLMGMAKSATEGAVARAKIEMWRKQAATASKPVGKPGFKPRVENQVYVAPGASVAFNTSEQPALGEPKRDPSTS